MPEHKDRQFYLGNDKLPLPSAKYDYAQHPEWVVDIDKCRKNILYFAENFFYIINLDKGKQKIGLHTYQKRILRSLRDNRFVILLSSRQSGKALALDTPINTPSGWTTMGDLKDGDWVYGINGTPCKVVKAHDTLYGRVCYEVEFDNGEKIVADEDHLWFTKTPKDSKGSVRTTKQILESDTEHRIPAVTKNEIFQPTSKWHYIKHIKQVNSVPVRCITVDSTDSLYLCGKTNIPTHNTTLMTIYALWVACFFDDQRVLIVANKEATAINIFKRVRMAYEQLPNYLKPGTVEYGKTSMTLGNGSSIGISTTSSDAGRGDSVNALVVDEMAFIDDGLVKEFWKSVYPIISASKKSKIFIASTPNGTGNLFHELYTSAVKKENDWHPERVDWHEVPGRDEEWKRQTIKTLGSKEFFDQEFGNCVCGETTIDVINNHTGMVETVSVAKLYDSLLS